MVTKKQGCPRRVAVQRLFVKNRAEPRRCYQFGLHRCLMLVGQLDKHIFQAGRSGRISATENTFVFQATGAEYRAKDYRQ